MTTQWVVCIMLVLVTASGAAAQPPYRWIDEDGNSHYVSRRDQVPERYRAQLGPVKPGEPPKPQLGADGRSGTLPEGCVLRLRSNEREAGSSHAYKTCEECWKVMAKLSEKESNRAECFGTH